MNLKQKQVAYIDRDLQRRGVHYEPLREDLIDHICSEVEQKMSQGVSFQNAHQEALRQFLPEEFKHLQKDTASSLTSMSLLKSYTKTAYRSLLRRKGQTFINLFGLSLSMCICLLIFIFIRYELSYDQQHPKQNIHRLTSTIDSGDGEVVQTAFTGAPWGPVMVEEFPELLSSARIMKYRLDVLVSNKEENKGFYEPNLIWGDQTLLDFFHIPILEGNEVLSSPHSVIITEEMAEKYFGNESPIGKVLSYENRVDLTVTGIINKP